MLAEMRQEVTDFQTRINAEFDQQRSQFDEAIKSFAQRFDSERGFDEAFSASVSEHLRLARDEGAAITANAIAEAEKMGEGQAVEDKYAALRDAVDDIGRQDSQSAILRSLVQHAGHFAPRGAFFIIKNEHFVGWKVFEGGGELSDAAIRDIRFSISADSILGAAARAGTTVEGQAGMHSEDVSFLDPLRFGRPELMYAIPLMARGRAVAVLYADEDAEGGSLNREALETLVRVAGLTVELLASSHAAAAEGRAEHTPDFETSDHAPQPFRREPEPAATEYTTPEPFRPEPEPRATEYATPFE